MFADLLSTNRETWGILAAVLLVPIVGSRLRAYLKLRQIPGPGWTGVSEIPHIRAFLSERCCNWYTAVSETEFWESVNVKPG